MPRLQADFYILQMPQNVHMIFFHDHIHQGCKTAPQHNVPTHVFNCWGCFLRIGGLCLLHQTWATSMFPNSSSVVLADQSTDFQSSSLPFRRSQANFSRAALWANGIFWGSDPEAHHVDELSHNFVPWISSYLSDQVNNNNHLGRFPGLLADTSEYFLLQSSWNLALMAKARFVSYRLCLLVLGIDATYDTVYHWEMTL